MSKYWEVIQLTDGTFALQSSEEGNDPLVTIKFSEEATSLLEGKVLDVARVMIGAGIQAASFDHESEDVHEMTYETSIH